MKRAYLVVALDGDGIERRVLGHGITKRKARSNAIDKLCSVGAPTPFSVISVDFLGRA